MTGLTPTTGGGVAALAGDLGNLAAAIPSAGDLVFIMNEADRTRALAISPGLIAVNIIVAPGLTAKIVIALDAADFVSGEVSKIWCRSGSFNFVAGRWAGRGASPRSPP